MAVDAAALKVELTTDPTGLGYVLNDNAADRDMLNLDRATIQVAASPITSADINRAMDWAEFASLSASKQRAFIALSQSGLDLEEANVRTALGAIFTVAEAPNSRNGLISLRNRGGSRAEQVFGSNVSTGDVAEALRTP